MRPALARIPIENRDPSLELNHVVEAVWKSFKGRVSREHVLEITRQVAELYRSARIRAFVPVFIQRAVHERLRMELQARSS